MCTKDDEMQKNTRIKPLKANKTESCTKLVDKTLL